jgi:hypothetical protein
MFSPKQGTAVYPLHLYFEHDFGRKHFALTREGLVVARGKTPSPSLAEKHAFRSSSI